MADRLSNRRRKEIGKLGRVKYRRRFQQMIVEGDRAVAAAIEAGAPLVDVVISKDRQGDPLVERVSVPVYVVSEGEMARLSDVETPQGVLAVVRTKLMPEDQLPARRTILALDGVQDPGNVGTALRTAAWFGAEAVLAGSGTAGLFNAKVVRAAMGGLWDVQLAKTKDLAGRLAVLREGHAFQVYGADLKGISIREWKPAAPSVLVLGSEAHGISSAVKEQLSERLVIEGSRKRQGTESLNVAVAGGILLYQWLG